MISILPKSWEHVGVKTYTGLSGCDMTLFYKDINIASIRAYSISQTREMAPIYVSDKPSSFSRGKRGLAGSMLFNKITLPENIDTIDYRYCISLITIGDGEEGTKCINVVTGVEFLDEGETFNLKNLKDDCKEQYTFIAQSITPWFKISV